MKKFISALSVLGLFALVVSPVFAKNYKIDVCHVTGNGSYHMINISERALNAHLAHGDVMPGEEVPEMEDYHLNEDCEIEEGDSDTSEYITNAFEGWPVLEDTENFGELLWQAEGRYGSNTDVGDWELGVGNNTQVIGEFDQANHVWGESPVDQEFTVEYDADTGIATFTVDEESVDYEVGMDTAGNLYLVARASSGVGDYVMLSDLELNGSLLETDLTANEGEVQTLQIEGVDLNSDFTVTGTVEMVYSTTSGSAPAFQLQVSSGI